MSVLLEYEAAFALLRSSGGVPSAAGTKGQCSPRRGA
jgi:hypothetical protein